MVKDKSPKDETPTKTNEDDVKENGTRKSETKETITPVVAKLAQKKARAQFFEDMYNSSGMSVSSSLTPEKPKRLCDMNLPSPRIGPGSPAMDKPKVIRTQLKCKCLMSALLTDNFSGGADCGDD